jgi:hypothetical protein
MILYQMVAGIPQLHSSLDFVVNGILICYGCSQIFEICQTFKGFMAYVYISVMCLCGDQIK